MSMNCKLESDMSTMTVEKGQVVVLTTPDNVTFDRTLAIVEEPTPWGAKVLVQGYVPGKPPGKYPFRAGFNEMIVIGTLPAGIYSADFEGVRGVNGPEKPVSKGFTREKAKEAGYTGDVCEYCQGSRMKRNGACLLCEDCQQSSGCS